MRSYLKVAVFAASIAASSLVAAQGSLTMAPPPPGAKHWPVVKEGTTVKISPHVYLIPDELVPQVPNVGIIVGSRATMIVDPGMRLLSGQAIARELAKVSRNTEVYIVNTHFHPEHATGDAAFHRAKIIRAAACQQDVDGMGMKWAGIFSERSAELKEVLTGATFRKPAETFEKEKTVNLGGVRVKLLRLGPAH